MPEPTLDDVLTSCAARNIRVKLNGHGGLTLTNSQALTPALRDALKRHKEQIVKEFSMPIFDYALFIFGGKEVDFKGRKVKPEQEGGFDLDSDTPAPA